MQENLQNIISVYSCDRLPYAIKGTIPDDYFIFAAKCINCRVGKFFTTLDEAKKYLNNQGTTHGLHEISLPKEFFIESDNRINPEYKVKPEDIKRLYLSSFFYKRDLTLTDNKNSEIQFKESEINTNNNITNKPTN